MNIGIIVHSQTGNTYSVAEKIKEKLVQKGHAVSLERVIAVDDDQPLPNRVVLSHSPDVTPYDVIIFGAPVRAFSLSSVMYAYLTQLSSLKGKKIHCLMTQFLPFSWMGGNRALRQFKNLCEGKEGTVLSKVLICWLNKNRRSMIDQAVEQLDNMIE